MKEITLKRGDKCPRCGGSFKAARVPTDAEYAKAFDRENPARCRNSATPRRPTSARNTARCTLHRRAAIRRASRRDAGAAGTAASHAAMAHRRKSRLASDVASTPPT
jgi:hypothetical protein